MSILFAVAGVIGSGKSAFADYLVQNYQFERVKFADPLKNMLREFLRTVGVTDPVQIERYIEGDLKEVDTPLLSGRSPRYFMQTIGTEWGRNIMSQTIWTDAATNKINLLRNQRKHVIVDDMRFPNEAALIYELGGVRFRVTRPDIVTQPHESEIYIPELPVEHEIFNNADLNKLYEEIEVCLDIYWSS